MSTATLRRRSPPAAKAKAPLVVYASSSLDGTSFALAVESMMRVREIFPKKKPVTTRRVFIAHDPREGFQRFEDQIVFLLTGVPKSALVKALGPISFQDPRPTEAEPLAQRRRA